jgi:hypothetical protein
MTWIDDDYEELKRQRQSAAELHGQESEIAGHASKIYEDLWAELIERINEAKTKRVTESPLLTNGRSYQRNIIIGTRKSLHPDAYDLSPAENKQSIGFKGPDAMVIPLRCAKTEWSGFATTASVKQCPRPRSIYFAR